MLAVAHDERVAYRRRFNERADKRGTHVSVAGPRSYRLSKDRHIACLNRQVSAIESENRAFRPADLANGLLEDLWTSKKMLPIDA